MGNASAASGLQHSALYGSYEPSLLRDEVLPEIFGATVSRRANHPAFISSGRCLTYADVDFASDQIARGLIRDGVGPGHIVGLWLPRGIELLLCQLAITKAGAAWLPFDAETPVARIAACLTDAQAIGLLAAETSRLRGTQSEFLLWTADELRDPGDTRSLTRRTPGLTPEHPAYLIYTSGSTGRPKGIVVSHRNICHYLRAANLTLGYRAEDVVFQGASAAFDLSVEEVWIPYLVGATLRVATPEEIGDPERLSEVMQKANVTVFETVPTLLGLLGCDVPSLRVVNLGGEVVPASLVARWWRPGRRIFNSYGPTETTIGTTVAELKPGDPVTIGRPNANCSCYVVTEDLLLAPPGRPGELLIGGPGVTKGYVGRPELTAEKFIPNPFRSAGLDPVLYRSGDTVSLDQSGNLVFHGRADGQVKIRGFRVELGEIEAKLTDLPGVAQAAVLVCQSGGLDQLVGFLVPERSQRVAPNKIRSSLSDLLPSYMVPAEFEMLDALPRLASGKIDRNALRDLVRKPVETAAEQEAARTRTEEALLAAARTVFPAQAITLEADFFDELGGHSLLAARFISEVRRTLALGAITFRDVYAARSLRKLALLLDERKVDSIEPADLGFEAPPWRRRFMCGLAQAASLPFILTLASMRTLGAFVSYSFLSRPGFGLMAEVAIIVGVYVAINSIILALTIAAKWLIIGRTKPGRYPLWGLYFYRWWLVQQLTNLAGSSIFQRSPLMPVYLRAMGAAVGTDCQIGVVGSGAIDLLTIGNGTSLAAGVQFANAQVVGNELIIGSVSLGDDVYVGSSCVIGHDVVIGNGAELCDLTSIDSGQKIEDDQRWDGSPGRHIGRVQTEGLPPAAKPRRGRAAMLAVVHGLVGMVLLPGIVLLPMLPAFSIFDWVDRGVAAASSWYFPLYVLTVALPAAFTCIGVTLLLFTAVRWVILPRVRPGCYSVYSWFSLRYWIVGICSDMILEETLHGLFPTIYMRAWYRCMGTSIGRQAEISTSFGARLDLTHIGDQSFVADAVAFGGEELRRGWMILKPVKTQARVFVGNSAVVAPGTCVPAGALIGVGSKAPLTGMNPGDTWFGSPPMKLPLRQTFAEVSKNWTFEPSRFRQFARSLIEAFSLSLPMALLATLTITAVAASAVRSPSATWHVRLGLFALTALLIPIAMALFVVTAKWIIMGRYEPTMKPMWSWWALLTVRVDVLYSGVAAKMLLDRLRGTPMLPWMLRLFGSKIGKGTFMDTTDLTEFDCVQIGNFASLNAGSALQTHLYEDRIMKVGRLSIGDGATLGTASVILYDSTVGAFARLAPLTVVMKGESIPAHTEWQGAPAVRRQDRTGRCVS